MNPYLGWVLVAVAGFAGWRAYGWQGVVAVATVAVFWLLLQFNRSLKVLKNAGHAPVGWVPSGVMFNAGLRPGMTMLQVVGLAKSLGRSISQNPETWAWTDDGGVTVTMCMADAKLESWRLTRQESPAGLTESGTGLPSP